MIRRGCNALGFVVGLILLAGCGEPMYENSGSQNTLLEDREACAMEFDKSPAAVAYRQDPLAHPEFPSQVFEGINRCIEGKGWKQVRSSDEQEQLRDAIATEATRTTPPLSISDSKATDAFARAVEDRLARISSSVQGGMKKD